jgi:hypothetical protein
MSDPIDNDHYIDNIFSRIADLEDQLDDLKRFAKTGLNTFIKVDVNNFSNPPTDTQLDDYFGQPSDVGEGFAILINDAGLSSNFYLVMSDSVKWWIFTATVAV